ncbi:hypothetical protein [Roseivirga pacifica]|uniref:hypothetical protein n=1 Tax=Roseivirga pacifica TaxID=1267423 RepID=UPI002096381A|nr:hypothetical protein [Roseivirga pacifica]MCO6358569.1 hypothetical protein [Roseivirga pacifica]MCO6366645.1 hypothetical protein [Roseivirga pacifica]MCO6369309.1 hypothetical protein [Roseivirga pacifica]MCO6374313.1 hypothetical protein [Roseivirga pacifica]MCO6378501.1 hypothetical protein [Roseivirga pacifica]
MKAKKIELPKVVHSPLLDGKNTILLVAPTNDRSIATHEVMNIRETPDGVFHNSQLLNAMAFKFRE